MLSPPRDQLVTAPPVVPWREWYAREQYVFRQKNHVLIEGPTQSGKTTLARHVVRIRRWVVVLGTKPNEDPALLEYEEEGYLRIDHWPPTDKDWRDMPRDEGRFLLWPQIVQIDDAQKFRPVYEHAMKDVFVDGKWCIVVDEGLFMTDKQDGLGLGNRMAQLAYGSASNKVSLVVLTQRIAGIGPIVWTNVSQALLFHSGRTEDVRDLASLGTYPVSDAAEAIKQLRGHQFLDLPVRAQAEWAISEVDPAWLA